MRASVGIGLLVAVLSAGAWAAEARLMLEGHRDAVTCLAYAPDGKTLATGSKDGTVRLWDAAGKERATLPGHERMVTALAFAPDGKALATAGYDKGIKVWDAAGGKPTATL